VSPELGRALIQLCAGNVDEASSGLDRAREQAPGVAYVEVLAGTIASDQKDAARARGRFEAALALAPEYRELDGWLSETRLTVAQVAVSEGRPLAEVAADFRAAVLFAERAAATEAKVNPKNADFAFRQALVQLQAQDLPERKRFEAALRTAEAVLAQIRAERRALAVKGYCNYRLGTVDAGRYDQCLRDFQGVLDTQPPEGDPWRDYATAARKAVMRWMSLEEKVVEFDEPKLSADWWVLESHGIRVGPDTGSLVFKDLTKSGATDDGNDKDATAIAKGRKLCDKQSFESVQVWVTIPRRDTAANNVVFGVVLQGPTQDGKGLARNQGFGLFYDRGDVAVRIGGGMAPGTKDGELHKVLKDGKPIAWPEDATGGGVLVEFERSRTDDTEITIRLNNQDVVTDKIPSFRRSKSEQELWMGGWSNKAQNWDLRVEKVRIVRTK
jgi:tetratricopeptide (TPR) repeat protein